MDLALEFTFSKPALDAAVAAGKYSNIRLFQYGDMGAKYDHVHTPPTRAEMGSRGHCWIAPNTHPIPVARHPNPVATHQQLHSFRSVFCADSTSNIDEPVCYKYVRVHLHGWGLW